jgi:hypothetical protein
MRFDIYATGQYRENYGAHDWNGEGECPQYWKSKGSASMLLVSNVGLDQLTEERVAAEARCASGELNESSNYSTSYYSGVVLLPAGANSDLRFLIENEVSMRDAPMYVTRKDWQETVDQYREWVRYFGLEERVGLLED